jgi:hypothetical protein
MSAPRTNVVLFPYTDRPGKVFSDSRHPEIARLSDHWQALYKARTRLERQERRALRRLLAAVDRNLSFEALNATRAMVARDRANRLRRSGDAVLLAADEELWRLLDEADDIQTNGLDGDACYERTEEVMDIIDLTPPATLEGCAAKLRFLADEEQGIEGGERPHSFSSLRQVLAFLDAIKSGGTT